MTIQLLRDWMLKTDVSFNTFVKVYDNVLTEKFCRNVCRKMDSDDRKKLGVFGKYKKSDPNFKSSFDLRISGLSDWQEEDNVFFTTISEFLKKYQNDIQTSTGGKFSSWDPEDYFSDTGYQVKVYNPGGHYDWHQDYVIDGYNGVRELTFIWYLNEDFDEGETEFFNGE